MKILKKVLPYLIILVLAVAAYFMFAKSKIEKALSKTNLSKAQQDSLVKLAKEAYATVLETTDDVEIVISFQNKAKADKHDKALKLLGFTNNPDLPLRYTAVLAKKK